MGIYLSGRVGGYVSSAAAACLLGSSSSVDIDCVGVVAACSRNPDTQLDPARQHSSHGICWYDTHTHISSSVSFFSAFRAMHWKASSTFTSSLAEVSK